MTALFAAPNGGNFDIYFKVYSFSWPKDRYNSQEGWLCLKMHIKIAVFVSAMLIVTVVFNGFFIFDIKADDDGGSKTYDRECHQFTRSEH